MPMTPFIGVRISWLMLARKSDFNREALSAVSRALDMAASASASAVTSATIPISPALPPSPVGNGDGSHLRDTRLGVRPRSILEPRKKLDPAFPGGRAGP